MRWTFNHTLATVACIVIVSLTVLLYFWPHVDDPSHKVQTKATSMPKDRLASIQRQLKTAREFDAQLQVTIYYQGPVPVRVAWRKPDFVFIHVGRFGDNPATWYWFENQQLCVYEEWPARGARGVCVTNVVQLVEGDAERAFELVLTKSINLAHYGNVGLGLIHLIQNAAAERMDINETETAWQFTAAPDAFDAKLMEPFLPGTNDRTFVVFELPRMARTKAEIDAIRVGWEPVPPEPGISIPPEAGIIAKFEALKFSFDRERLRIPNPPPGMMKTVEVKNADALNPEIIDSLRPIPIVE